jgi:hypothetical protein
MGSIFNPTKNLIFTTPGHCYSIPEKSLGLNLPGFKNLAGFAQTIFLNIYITHKRYNAFKNLPSRCRCFGMGEVLNAVVVQQSSFEVDDYS